MKDFKELEISATSLDAILKFLPEFEKPGFKTGEWVISPNQLPHYIFSRIVDDFVKTLYDEEFLIVFDWCQWWPVAACYIDNPELLEQANLLTLRKLLTLHIRADQFCEGHLAGVMRNGEITAILHRLQQIRNGMN
jgi:hypothetical protein